MIMTVVVVQSLSNNSFIFDGIQRAGGVNNSPIFREEVHCTLKNPNL